MPSFKSVSSRGLLDINSSFFQIHTQEEVWPDRGTEDIPWRHLFQIYMVRGSKLQTVGAKGKHTDARDYKFIFTWSKYLCWNLILPSFGFWDPNF